MMMVMKQSVPGKFRPEKRCPYCFSKQLHVEDASVSEGVEKRFGRFKFICRCKRCGGACVDLSDLKTEEEYRLEAEKRSAVTT